MASLNRETKDFFPARLVDRQWISDHTFILKVSKPERFSFNAGQSVQLLCRGFSAHYTPASGPKSDTIELLIRHIPGGRFTPMLAEIPIAEPLSIAAAQGYFTFRPSERPAIFVATGTGIAPFAAMASDGARGFTLFHGVRRLNECYYQSLMMRAAVRYIPCISVEVIPKTADISFFQGRVTEGVKSVLPPGRYDFYLCGRREMGRDIAYLVDDQYSDSRIYSEIFF
jgi:NAD(P)H-flavin reductase